MKFHSRHIGIQLAAGTVLILLVSSCSLTIQRLDQPIAAVAPSPTSPVFTHTDTPAPLPTLASVPTAAAPPGVDLLEECIPLEEKLPDDLVLSGIWVRNRARPYLETMDGRTAYGVPLRGGGIFSTLMGDMTISPDGRNLAYIDPSIDDTGHRTKSRVLRIVNSSGHSLPMDYWIIDWQWLIGWLDNQHLAIFTGNKEILVLEPFTGKWERLRKPAWLDRMEYDYRGVDGPFYSPSLERILIKPDYATFELRDFETGQILYQGKGNRYLTDRDVDWSMDGSTLAANLGDLLHIITEDQRVIELEAGKLGIDRFDDPELSPDGRKLVFTSWWSGKWFLFDTQQAKIRKLCNEEFDYFEHAVWSPDGRFVVQEAEQSDSGPFDLLIDTQQLRAYKLPSGQYQHRLVWLAEP